MFRVYDKEEKQWIKKDIFLAINSDLYMAKKSKVRKNIYRLDILPDSRYIFQLDTGLHDKNKHLIFEGDFVQANDNGNNVEGLIIYAPDMAAYILLDYKEKKHYPLNAKICSEIIEVIGNLYDTPELLLDTVKQGESE